MNTNPEWIASLHEATKRNFEDTLDEINGWEICATDDKTNHNITIIPQPGTSRINDPIMNSTANQFPFQSPHVNFTNFANQSFHYPIPQYQFSLPKLPPIHIPKFSGQWKEWQQFYAVFSTVIHNRADIPPVAKLGYLLTYVEGEAKRTIGHLHVSNENYPVALRLLEQRYKNKRRIVTNYIEEILNIKKANHP